MSQDDFAELLSGAQAIASFTGKNYRQTTYLLSTGQLPGYKIGSVWYGRKSKIRARLLGEEAEPPPDKAKPGPKVTALGTGRTAEKQAHPSPTAADSAAQASNGRAGA